MLDQSTYTPRLKAEYASRVRAALKDAEPAVRAVAALALYQIDQKTDGFDILTDIVTKEKEATVRVEAIKAP